MKIYITAPFSDEVIENLQKNHEIVFEPWSEDAELMNEKELNRKLIEAGCDVFICESDIVTEKVLENVQNLKMICVCRAGVNDIDLEACTKKHILVTNTPGRNAEAVAEFTVALMIMSCRFISRGERAIREGRWVDNDTLYFQMRGIELPGRSVSFIGFGEVPKKLSKLLKAFGVKMYAYDPFVAQETADEYEVTMVSLEEAFERGDFVSNHLPVTKETKRLLDKRLFIKMKKEAVFLNTARAATIVEADIVNCLRNSKIAGACFDVFEEEPISMDSPLLALDNVIVTPHLAGASLDVVANHSQMVQKDITLFVNGAKPAHLVNKEVLDKS